MDTEAPELALEAAQDVLQQLVAWLPGYVIRVRRKGITSPVVPSLVRELISNALAKGYLIDRTNGEGPLDQWDGWLKIETPEAPIYIQMDKSKIGLD